jgi:hypothetical protein
VGTPAARGLTQATGAGHGEAGDAPSQGPAREDVLSAQPKSANSKKPAKLETAKTEKLAISFTAPVIELTAVAKPETAETRDTGLVMTRPKPEKRKNAKERAKDKFAKDKEKTAEDRTRPMTATAKSDAEAKAKAERKAEVKVAAKAAKTERKKARSAGKRAAAKAA